MDVPWVIPRKLRKLEVKTCDPSVTVCELWAPLDAHGKRGSDLRNASENNAVAAHADQPVHGSAAVVAAETIAKRDVALAEAGERAQAANHHHDSLAERDLKVAAEAGKI